MTGSQNSSHGVFVPTPRWSSAHSLHNQVNNILSKHDDAICRKNGSDMHTGLKGRLTSFIKLASSPGLAYDMLLTRRL